MYSKTVYKYLRLTWSENELFQSYDRRLRGEGQQYGYEGGNEEGANCLYYLCRKYTNQSDARKSETNSRKKGRSYYGRISLVILGTVFSD